MAAQAIVATVVPQGRGSTAASLRFSIHFSPRLQPPSVVYNTFGTFTSNFAEFRNWPNTILGALNSAPFVMRQYSGGVEVGSPLSLSRGLMKSVVPDPALWQALFFSQMPITPFDPNLAHTKYGGATFRSYPLMALHDDQVARWSDLVQHHGNSDLTPGAHLSALGPIANATNADSKTGLLADISGRYTRLVGRFAKAIPSGSRRVGAGTASSPTDARGYDYAHLLHFLEPRTSADYIRLHPITAPVIDFHQAIALLADHPALLRTLGLVLDFEVSGTIVGTTLALDAIPAITNSMVRPRTRVDIERNVAPPLANSPLTPDRGVDLTRRFNVADDADQTGWDLVMLDVEGSATKSLAVAASALKAVGAVGPGAPTSIESPALRHTGLRLVRSSRAVELASQLKRNDDLLVAADQNAVELYLDDLVRGYRLDVWDAHTGAWHSLTRRDLSYTQVVYGTVAAPDSSSTAWYSNEGVLSTAITASADHTSTSTDVFVGETFAEWSGWSLVAPRPGKALPPGGGTVPVENNPAKHPDLQLLIETSVPPQSLPSLRFGNLYAVRLRTADIVGGGPRLTDFGHLPTDGYATYQVRYGRYEPLPPPAVAPQAPFKWNDSLTHLVILNYNAQSPVPAVAHTVRHVLPPAAPAALIEAHGGFDVASAAQAYTLITQRDGVRLAYGPSPDWMPMKYVGAQDPRGDSLARALYFKDDIVQPPWLIDRMVTGLRLAGLGVPETFLGFTPRVATDAWWNRRGWQFEMRPLGPGSVVKFSKVANSSTGQQRLYIDVPIGKMFDIALSSVPDPARLNHLAAYNQMSASLSPADATSVLDAISHGRNRRVSPPTTLKAIHAVQIPTSEPFVDKSVTVTRDAHSSWASLSGTWNADPFSTSRLDINLDWSEPNDLDATGPSRTNGSAHLPAIQIPYPPEPGTVPSPQGFQHLPVNFGDTKHRLVSVWNTATSRYASFFAVTTRVTLTTNPTLLRTTAPHAVQQLTERVQLDNGQSLERDTDYGIDYVHGTIWALAGSPALSQSVQVHYVPLPVSRDTTLAKRAPVHVPASSKPNVPRISEVVPAFNDSAWSPLPSGGLLAGRQRSRDGRVLRVYLERPWFSSGDDELLGVVLRRSDVPVAGNYLGVVASGAPGEGPRPHDQLVTSAWGRDPLIDGEAVLGSLTASSFPNAFNSPRYGKWAVNTQDASLGVATIVVPHAVQYDAATHQWFADIAFDLGAAYRPFVRLALCRFQPYALTGAHMSDVVLVDAAQLSPQRTMIVTGVGNTRTVTLVGPAYAEQVVGYPAGRPFSGTAPKRLAPLVEVQLQRKPLTGAMASADPDVGWSDYGKARALVLQPTLLSGRRSKFTLAGVNVVVPAGYQRRLVIREYERETQGPATPSPRRRMVFADSMLLL